MLTVKENERLTKVGPGTPMGELLRRYWHPISAAAELDDSPVKPVKLLGESLVLYRDRQGRLGLSLVDQRLRLREAAARLGGQGRECQGRQDGKDRRQGEAARDGQD